MRWTKVLQLATVPKYATLCHHYAHDQLWSWRFSPKAKVKNWTNSLTVRSFRQQKRLTATLSSSYPSYPSWPRHKLLPKLVKDRPLLSLAKGVFIDLLWSTMIYWTFQWHVVVWFQIGNQENLMLWTKMFSKHLKTIQNLRFPELSASICRILRWWSKPIAFKETVPSPPGSRYRKTAAIRASKREPFFRVKNWDPMGSLWTKTKKLGMSM